MARFIPSRKYTTDFNNGEEYVNGVDSPAAQDFNSVIESQLFVQGLGTNQPDVSEANNTGAPSVEIVTAADGSAKLKFNNLKGANGIDGVNGTNGTDGKDGLNGSDGKSAYDIAIQNGFIGTEKDWLDSLHGADGTNGKDGADGKSAYEIAQDNGFTGTEAEWLNSLKGEKGDQGAQGATGAKGEKGETGAKGDNGTPFYAISFNAPLNVGEHVVGLALSFFRPQTPAPVTDNYGITTGGYLCRIIKQQTNYDLVCIQDLNGTDGTNGTNGKDGADGTNGTDGKSAYEYAQDGGYTGTEEEFYTALSQYHPAGEDGPVVRDAVITEGLSNYMTTPIEVSASSLYPFVPANQTGIPYKVYIWDYDTKMWYTSTATVTSNDGATVVLTPTTEPVEAPV